jgi:hypothetical protein
MVHRLAFYRRVNRLNITNEELGAIQLEIRGRELAAKGEAAAKKEHDEGRKPPKTAKDTHPKDGKEKK